MVPAVSTLEMIEPDIMPSRPLAKMQTFAAPPRKVPHIANAMIDEELAGAGHHQRGAEHQKADHGVGERLDRNAEQAFARQHVIGGRLFEGRVASRGTGRASSRQRTADRR